MGRLVEWFSLWWSFFVPRISLLRLLSFHRYTFSSFLNVLMRYIPPLWRCFPPRYVRPMLFGIINKYFQLSVLVQLVLLPFYGFFTSSINYLFLLMNVTSNCSQSKRPNQVEKLMYRDFSVANGHNHVKANTVLTNGDTIVSSVVTNYVRNMLSYIVVQRSVSLLLQLIMEWMIYFWRKEAFSQ